MTEKIYVVGHKNPDCDSICAPIALAYLKNQIEKSDSYTPVRTGELNLVSAYVLKKFNIPEPEKIVDFSEKPVFLIDHTDPAQRGDKIEPNNVIGIIDHHQINFSSGKIIPVRVEPWGSSATIIAQMFFENKVKIPKEMAGILLSCILDDTVILKSKITTKIDKKLAKKLSKIAEIGDIKDYGLELFKVKSNISGKTAEEIVNMDYKDYSYPKAKFGIGQAETVSPEELTGRKEEILGVLRKIKEEKKLNMTIMMISDILKLEGTFFVVADDESLIKKVFGKPLKDNEVKLKKMISRKKDVVPALEKALS